MRINSGKDILDICSEKNLSISEVAIIYEGIKGQLTREEILKKMNQSWLRMS
jgi:L-serine deaminase